MPAVCSLSSTRVRRRTRTDALPDVLGPGHAVPPTQPPGAAGVGVPPRTDTTVAASRPDDEQHEPGEGHEAADDDDRQPRGRTAERVADRRRDDGLREP